VAHPKVKYLVVGLVTGLCLALILACGGGNATQSSTPGNTQASAAPTDAAAQKKTYAVGETAELNGLKVTVNEVKPVEGNQVMKPEAGKQFIVVNVTFENTTAKDVPVSSMLQMELKDDTGQAYSIDIGAMTVAGGKQPDGTIVAGDKLRGPIGYQVPVGAKGLQWIFKDVVGSGRVVFDIKL